MDIYMWLLYGLVFILIIRGEFLDRKLTKNIVVCNHNFFVIAKAMKSELKELFYDDLDDVFNKTKGDNDGCNW